MYVYVCVCVSVCIHMYMYIYVYLCICIYMYIHIYWLRHPRTVPTVVVSGCTSLQRVDFLFFGGLSDANTIITKKQ